MKSLDRLWARIASTYMICKEADFGLRLAFEPKGTGDADKDGTRVSPVIMMCFQTGVM